jgi:hypothetical protein
MSKPITFTTVFPLWMFSETTVLQTIRCAFTPFLFKAPCDATFYPSTPSSMRWLYLKIHMLPVKEKCKCISRC